MKPEYGFCAQKEFDKLRSVILGHTPPGLAEDTGCARS